MRILFTQTHTRKGGRSATMVNEERILEILLGIQHDMSGLKEDVSGLKQDVSTLKEDVSGLKQDVSTLKEDVSGLKQDISTLKEDVSGLRQDVAALQTDVDMLKVDVADIKQRQIRMDNRQNEQHDFLNALLHNQEVANATLEELRLTTAKIESVQQVQQEVNVLGSKVYNMALAK